MECHVRPLNKGEFFCCSIKKAKEIFGNTEVYLDFAYLGRNYKTFSETADGYYWKNNIKGRVIASLMMRVRDASPILSFYVIKSDEFSEALREEFETKYLCRFYTLYLNQMKSNSLTNDTRLMLMEIVDGKLILHEGSIKY